MQYALFTTSFLDYPLTLTNDVKRYIQIKHVSGVANRNYYNWNRATLRFRRRDRRTCSRRRFANQTGASQEDARTPKMFDVSTAEEGAFDEGRPLRKQTLITARHRTVFNPIVGDTVSVSDIGANIDGVSGRLLSISELRCLVKAEDEDDLQRDETDGESQSCVGNSSLSVHTLCGHY